MLRKAVQSLYFFLPSYILLLYILLHFSACTKHPVYSKHENENHFETSTMDAAAVLALGHQEKPCHFHKTHPLSASGLDSSKREQAPSCHSRQLC